MEGNDYVVPVHLVGGIGGNAFNLEHVLQGKRVEKITVWPSDKKIRGIQITLTDSEPELFGMSQQGVVGTSFEFKAGETIVALTFWANRDGKGLGGIQFDTSEGNKFDVQTREMGSPVSINQLGDGVCVGAEGRHCDSIDSFGFVFLKPVKSAVTTDVLYPELADHPSRGIETVDVDSYEITNRNDDSQDWHFEMVVNIENKSTWSYKSALYSESVELILPVPHIVAGPEGKWALSKLEKNVGKGNSCRTYRSHEVQWSHSGSLPPRSYVKIVASTNIGKMDVEWRGKVLLTFQDGDSITYPIVGKYQGFHNSWMNGVFSTGPKIEE